MFPSVYLSQIVVFKSGKKVLDLSFHQGVNIVRGANSTGKTTLADLIFFAFGGDIVRWTPEAEKCDSVIAEVAFNETTLTLRRRISAQKSRPLDIFWGPLSEALMSAEEGWSSHGYRRTEKLDSFTQVLLRALNIPFIESEKGDAVTMHQLMRLIYIDQSTSTDVLFRDEQFDSPSIRKAVFDLLTGVYDEGVYGSEMKLKDIKKELQSKKSALANAKEAFDSIGVDIRSAEFQKGIAMLEDQRDKLKKTIAEFDKDENVHVKDADNELRDIQNELRVSQTRLSNSEAELLALNFEIEDSGRFINSLRSRIVDLEDSLAMHNYLDSKPPTHCPHCLQLLVPPSSVSSCPVCRKDGFSTPSKSQVLRMREEMLGQIRESELIIKRKSERADQVRRELPVLRNTVKSLRGRISSIEMDANSAKSYGRSQAMYALGEVQTKIDVGYRNLKAISYMQDIESDLSRLAEMEGALTQEVELRSDEIRKLQVETLKCISEKAIELIHSDLKREEEFQAAKYIKLDPLRDIHSVDNRTVFSASSSVILKNSSIFGMFFASLELESMRFPRFILCDNIEDKGMEEQRSQNFQLKLVAQSEESKTPHQIIFTTSMIAPSLNNSKYCVGDYLTPERKLLHLV